MAIVRWRLVFCFFLNKYRHESLPLGFTSDSRYLENSECDSFTEVLIHLKNCKTIMNS